MCDFDLLQHNGHNVIAHILIQKVVHLKLFFISRSLAMASTGSVFPVAFCISGSSILMKTLCFFSSPIVNLPCVSLLFSANVWSFLTGSLCRTDIANFTLAFVYSWPG